MAHKPRVGISLRLADTLRRRIEKAAKAHDQSMNAEIIARLEATFRTEDFEANVDKLAERVVVVAMSKIEAAGEAAAKEDFDAKVESLMERLRTKAEEEARMKVRIPRPSSAARKAGEGK